MIRNLVLFYISKTDIPRPTIYSETTDKILLLMNIEIVLKSLFYDINFLTAFIEPVLPHSVHKFFHKSMCPVQGFK